MKNVLVVACLLACFNSFSLTPESSGMVLLKPDFGRNEKCNSSLGDTLHYKVTADDHGFMCPFLTPMFITKITNEGALRVQKDKDLTIWFDVVAPSELTPDRVKSILVSIGYMESIIHISTFP